MCLRIAFCFTTVIDKLNIYNIFGVSIRDTCIAKYFASQGKLDVCGNSRATNIFAIHMLPICSSEIKALNMEI